MVVLRLATLADLPVVLPRTRAFNAVEGISIDDVGLEGALAHLLSHPELGAVWMIELPERSIGHGVVSYGYDLEFAGRDAFLTELWIDPAERGQGAAARALGLLDVELRSRQVRALHLMVRPDNPALRLYERAGFERVPRLTMTRRL